MSEPYTFTVDGFPADHFKVHVFTGRETISEPYAFDLVVTSDGTSNEEMERLALGQRAVLSWNVGGAPRAFYGTLAAVELEEIHEVVPRTARYRMRLVPRLWLLRRKRRTRIFQKMRVRDIVDAVLSEAGIATRWALLRDHPIREYCTQYEESDYRFISRLLAESGIYFFFHQGPLAEDGAAAGAPIPGDSLVFGEDSSGYLPIGKDAGDEPATDSDERPLYFLAMQQTSTSHADKVTRFSSRTTVRASTAMFRDYDPERPMARFVSSAESAQPFPDSDTPFKDGEVAAFTSPGVGAVPSLEVYEHHGPFLFPKWSFAKEEAPLILRQKRRRASIATGESGCPDLAPGHRFGLENHPAGHLNRGYVITTVEHRGEARPQGGAEWRTYRNTFSCAPVEVAYIPPRPKRRSVQVALTAIVVGPPGEEIHVDALGQIKVQFHWDRDGGYDDRSSCWIRTMHAWGGVGWGSQFIPRVGMEVVVVFEGGDTDKPMILGSLYNGTHPTPFSLPADKTRSGFRTQTSPGAGGFNELSFEDKKGGEQIFLHAQRDHLEKVEVSQSIGVGADQSIMVGQDRLIEVKRNQSHKIHGDKQEEVAGKQKIEIKQNAETNVLENCNLTVGGGLVQSAGARSMTTFGEHYVLKVAGDMTIIVGEGGDDSKGGYSIDTKRAFIVSTEDVVRLLASKKIELQCGDSRVTIAPEGVNIKAKSLVFEGASVSIVGDGPALHLTDDAELVSKSVRILTKDSSLILDADASIKGKLVKLNCGEEWVPANADGSVPAETKPFSVTVTDPDFKPYSGKTYVLVAGGRRFTGTVGGDGAVHHDISKEATNADLTIWEDDYPTGRRRHWAISIAESMPQLNEIAGVELRLSNLGYRPGKSQSAERVSPATIAVIAEFQKDHELSSTGELDAQTLAKLNERHGG